MDRDILSRRKKLDCIPPLYLAIPPPRQILPSSLIALPGHYGSIAGEADNAPVLDRKFKKGLSHYLIIPMKRKLISSENITSNLSKLFNQLCDSKIAKNSA